MRTLRAAVAAIRWIFDFSRIVWLTRIVTTIVVWTTMVFGASFATVAMNLPEGSWEPESVEVQSWPLSAYAKWTAMAHNDDEDDDFWIGCIADRDCVDRICSIDIEREQMETDRVEKVADIR